MRPVLLKAGLDDSLFYDLECPLPGELEQKVRAFELLCYNVRRDDADRLWFDRQHALRLPLSLQCVDAYRPRCEVDVADTCHEEFGYTGPCLPEERQEEKILRLLPGLGQDYLHLPPHEVLREILRESYSQFF